MPRFRNKAGVIINVDDATAATLAAEWTFHSGERTPKGEPEESSGEPKGNASKAEWAAYADSLGVEYPEDAKRDDIKAAVEAHVAEPATTPEASEGEPEQGEPTGSDSGIW